MCILLGMLKLAENEASCKRTPYFLSFLSKATFNQRMIMNFIKVSFWQEANYNMFGYKWP